ncbi:MAG: hypothetical protein V4726_23905 [Verrucomicrobiota bacterium]
MSTPLSPALRHFPPYILTLLCIACSSKENLGKTQELKAKIEEMKQQGDKLSAEARAVQNEIKATGSEDTTSEKIVKNLEAQETASGAEGDRLEKLAADLEAAKTQLEKEHTAFNKKGATGIAGGWRS